MTGFSPSLWYQYIDGSKKIILVQCDFHSSSDCHPSWKLKTESEYKQKQKKKTFFQVNCNLAIGDFSH